MNQIKLEDIEKIKISIILSHQDIIRRAVNYETQKENVEQVQHLLEVMDWLVDQSRISLDGEEI